MEENDLIKLKEYIRNFVNIYNIKEMYINIEEKEAEVLSVDMSKEEAKYKDITIGIEY